MTLKVTDFSLHCDSLYRLSVCTLDIIIKKKRLHHCSITRLCIYKTSYSYTSSIQFQVQKNNKKLQIHGGGPPS